MGYVDLEIPDEVKAQILEMLSVAKDKGKIKKGVNETTKSVERKQAKLVVIAEDVTPPEVVVHLPQLCKDANIPYAFVKSKKELGSAVGIEVGASSVAVEDPGDAAEKFNDLLKKLPKPKGEGA